MSFRLSRLKLPLVVSIAIGALLTVRGEDAPGSYGTPIQFSEPKNPTVSSNLSKLTSKQSSLRNLDDELKRPFQSLNLSDPFPESAPPVVRIPPPPIRNKRVKDLIEQNKDLMFLSPEDFGKGPTDAEIFRMPEYDEEGKEKKIGTPLQEFIKRADRKNLTMTNALNNADFTNEDEKDDSKDRQNTEENKWDYAVKTRMSALEAMSKDFKRDGEGTSIFSSDSMNANAGFWDGPRNGETFSRLEVEKKKRDSETRLQEFEKLFQGSAPSGTDPGGSSASALATYQNWSSPSSRPSPFDSSGAAFVAGSQSSFGSPASAVSPLQKPIGPADMSSLGSSSSQIPLFQSQDQSRPSIPEPVFSMPKRKF